MSNTHSTSSTDTEPPFELIGVATTPTLATELRRRRELLGWSQAEAARRSGVSRTVVNEIEAGRRVPSTRTYQRLREALGLATPVAAALLRRERPRDLTEEQLQVLAACLIAGRGGTLSALAEATGVSVPAVREGVLAICDRLAMCGIAAVDDGSEVRLTPHPWAAAAVSAVSTLEVQTLLTEEVIQVLVCVGVLGSPTRREVERLRGEDSESLLGRMVRRGLLEKTRYDSLPGDPNIYGLTAVALGAMGHASLESFRTWCTSQGSIEILHEPGPLDRIG